MSEESKVIVTSADKLPKKNVSAGKNTSIQILISSDVAPNPKKIPHWYSVEGDEPFEFLCLIPNLPDRIDILDKSK